MVTYVKIYGLIIIISVISAILEKKVRKHETKTASASAAFFAAYIFVVASFRTVMSNGAEFLSTSFAGKGLSGYVKVMLLLIAVYLSYTFVGIKIRDLIRSIIGVFAVIMCSEIVFLAIPDMMHMMVGGLVSIVLGVVLYLLRDTRTVKYILKEDGTKEKFKSIAVRLTLFAFVFLIEGPIELYAYNAGDFVFGFGGMMAALLAGSIIIVVAGSLLISEYTHGIVFDAVCCTVGIYSILNYIQAMFLNGRMETIDGGFQQWTSSQKTVNLVIWIVLGIGLIVFEIALKEGRKIMNTVALLLTLLLAWSSVSVLLTTGVLSSDKRQLVTDNMYTVSGKNDVIVLMLDAYDVQMMAEVTKDDPGYLKPLSDFTYYDNMESEYVYTDGELPYLFTGIKEDIGERTNKEYIDALYSQGNFLEAIAGDDCDIRVLTDCKYVEPNKEDIIDNYQSDSRCILDVDKTISQMSECIRYKGLPFIFKPHYHYEAYAFTNIIEDTNVYLFGTDYAFEAALLEQGIGITDAARAFRFYHLYGAHAAYYLTEDATLDYSSTPLAQWRGCLKIVYDYLEALKAIDAYDEATVIIMADHGLNNTNRVAAREFGYDFTEETNPIFFIKRSNEHHDEMQTDHKETSHDEFFATILKSFDDSATAYGKAIWE